MHIFSADTVGSEESIDALHAPNCLVVDDDMSVFNIARNLDFKVQPCTHYELMSSAGQQHFQGLHDRKYNFLWISLPQNYFHRTPPPAQAPKSIQQRHNAHVHRLQTWMDTARRAGSHFCIFGQPGRAWIPYLPTLNTARAKLHVLNLCAVDEKFDIGSPVPSRSCLHMYTTLSLDRTPLPCACKSDWKTHKLDWYGDDEAHAEWRRKARVHILTEVWSFIKPTIIDRLSPSPCLRRFRNKKFLILLLPLLPIPLTHALRRKRD